MADLADVEAFWSAFSRLERKLAEMSSADDPAYDELLGFLHRIDPRLFIEIGRGAGEAADLIITAEGDRTLFHLVRGIVARAPAVAGWNVVALKPKLGFPLATQWGEAEVQIHELRFVPLRRDGTLALGLRVFVRGLDERARKDVLSAVYVALDHGLGEELFAQRIEHVEVAALPEGIDETRLIPLTELERFLEEQDEKNKDLQ